MKRGTSDQQKGGDTPSTKQPAASSSATKQPAASSSATKQPAAYSASKQPAASSSATKQPASSGSTASFTSPIAKKNLLASFGKSPRRQPSATHQMRSPKSSTKKTIIGILIAKGEHQVAQTMNVFFEIKVKISEKDYEYVRLMTMGLSAEDEAFFQTNIGKAVKLENVSKTENNMQFYNERTGGRKSVVDRELAVSPVEKFYEIPEITAEMKTLINVKGHFFWLKKEMEQIYTGSWLRDGVLVTEKNDRMLLTVWGRSLIGSISEAYCYEFHDVQTKVHNALKIATTGVSVVMKTSAEIMSRPSDIDDLAEVAPGSGQQTKTFNAQIISANFVSVSIEKECALCSYAFTPEPNNDMPRCPDCNKRQDLEAMKEKRTASIDIMLEDCKVELSVEIDLVEKLFNLEKSNDVDHLDGLEIKFIKLKEATFKTDGRIVKSIATVTA